MSLPLRQTVQRGELARHRHAEAYVAVVLSGAYEEAGDPGRRRVEAGDVVIHRPWEAHLNRTPARAEVLNLPIEAAGLAAFGRVDDLDRLVTIAQRDLTAARSMLLEAFRPRPPTLADWPDALAATLTADGPVSLAGQAERLGVSREYLSRGFRRMFGITPQRFAWETRCRAALQAVRATDEPLADLAAGHGFADQAHMTRAIRDFSGRTPGAWRRSNPFKTAA
ncbi:MAG: AraC family transcriptional regulator [Pseudomonadota bacterium]